MTPTSDGRLRIASFNLLHGMSPDDGRVDAGRLVRAVRVLDADVLALQEVDRNQLRSGSLDLAKLAAEAIGAADWRFVPAVIGTPGERWRPAVDGETSTGPAYGIAIASRLPVHGWRTVHLPPAPMRAPVRVSRPGPGRARRVMLLLDDEPRVGLAAVVEVGGQRITVAGTHLSYVPGWNVRQLRLLRHRLRDLPRPRVLVGDLNMPGRLPAAVTGWSAAVRAATFPAGAPQVQLDHVLVEPGPLVVRGSGALALELSDHRAVYADLTMPAPM